MTRNENPVMTKYGKQGDERYKLQKIVRLWVSRYRINQSPRFIRREDIYVSLLLISRKVDVTRTFRWILKKTFGE